jgi:hypothetical protein
MGRMADITTIFVAGIGAVTTLLNGVGGYWLSGRNDEARDIRTLQREQTARKEERDDRLQEQRHEWQRQTLLDLQDELQKLARAIGKILQQDLLTVPREMRSISAARCACQDRSNAKVSMAQPR